MSAGVGLQHVAGDFRRLLDHRLRRLAHHHAAHAHRARRMRAAADRHDVGVALDEPDAVDVDAEPFADALREAGLVALAAGQRADRDVDAALGQHVDLGIFARRAAGRTRCSWRARCRAACRCACDSRLRAGKPLPVGRARAHGPSPWRSRRSRRSCRAGWDRAAPTAGSGCAGAGRCGRSRTAAPRCRSAARSRTSPPAARRCDRGWSAPCWSAPRARGYAPPAPDRPRSEARCISAAARTSRCARRHCRSPRRARRGTCRWRRAQAPA